MLPPGGRPNTPPYWEADVEEWWRVTTHTRLPDETFNSIVASDPLALYQVVPPHVMQRRKAEAAALAAAVALQAAAAAAQVVSGDRFVWLGLKGWQCGSGPVGSCTCSSSGGHRES